jgi:hypothetical protein
MLSLLDRFSSYDQVLISQPYHINTTFRMKWGTYTYHKMPFGLISVGATFQREMDIAFIGLINKSMVFYLYDDTIFSKNRKYSIII